MATGRACFCSAKCSYFCIKSLNLDALLAHRDELDLSYDGKRLKWNGSFEDLKYFFEIVVGLNGKWSSPGGNSKKLSNCKCNITITWYYWYYFPIPGKGRVFTERHFNKILCSKLYVKVLGTSIVA